MVGKLRFLVAERPDLGYEVLKLSRQLAAPHGKDLVAVKRLIRYVCGTTGYVLQLYPDKQKDLRLQTWGNRTTQATERHADRSVAQ